MKKSILIILLIFIMSASVFGVDRVDMIVLLDNSVSVLPYYDNIQNSLVKKIITEHLEPGDTFSLITFADYPEVEISREIRNETDIEEILAYSSIIQPMGNHTDLVLALRFLYKYTLDLPLSNRKKIVILTDGIHDPPDDSPYFLSDPGEINEAVEKASADIHREGWEVSIVELETDDDVAAEQGGSQSSNSSGNADSEQAVSSGNGKSGADVIDTVSETLGSKPNTFNNNEADMAGIALGVPRISIPGSIGDVTDEIVLPLGIENRGNETMLFSLSAVNCEGSDILIEKAAVKLEPGEYDVLDISLSLPEDCVPGEYSKEISLKLVGGIETDPRTLKLNFNVVEQGGFNRGLNFFLDWRVIAIIAGIIVAILVIILIKRASAGRSHGYYLKEDGEIIKPVKVFKEEQDEYGKIRMSVGQGEDDDAVEEVKASAGERAAGKKHKPEEYLMASIMSDAGEDVNYKKNRPVQMLVYGQNTKLGITNVKWLGLNRRRAIGSASSCIFRIFFIRVPSVVAYIECTGDDFIFTPEKAEYFPDIDGPVHNCLNKRFRIVNPDNKMFYIEFRQWISELEKVNRLLTLTKNSGTPDFDY